MPCYPESEQRRVCGPVPVEPELTNRLQDVDLIRVSELLTADAADDETARPPDPRTDGQSRENKLVKLHFFAANALKC